MWSFFRQDEPEQNDAKAQHENVLQVKKGGLQKRANGGKQRLGFGRHKANQQQQQQPSKRHLPDDGEEPPDVLNISVNDEAMNVAETHSGIEVSLDWKAAANSKFNKTEESPTEGDAGPTGPVVSLDNRLRQSKRVRRSQFSVGYPALDRLSTVIDESQLKSQRRNHRVPILDVPPEYNHSYSEMVALLEKHETKDETTAVRNEIEKLKSELEAIEDDRSELDQSFLRLPAAQEQEDSETEMGVPNWDVNYLLGARKDLTPSEKSILQQNRGLCLTLNMQNPRAREAFLSKCGSKVEISHGKHVLESFGASVSLGPYNCRHGGAGTTMRHMAVMSGGDTGSSFFLSRDSGKSFTWGPLPPRLYRRMTQEGITPQNGDGGLLYLSTGPRGCYYCQFQSGECWWGNAIEDDHDFESIVDDWDVYRVSFGPIVTYEDEDRGTKTTNSWIILSRDGRVAWKNLPSRLHNRLYGRLADWAAPVEVSLGAEDSYFIRFLDGTIDYCLPANIASVCEHIEQNGGIITNILLHPDVSHDYVIRHTELTA